MKNVLLSLILLATLFTCKVKDVDPCGCEGPINCTLEYRNLIVQITDVNGKPYLLDEYKVIRLEDGQDIILKNDEYMLISQSQGMYLLLGDRHQALTDQCGKVFRFTGLKDGKEVISKDYLIAHDCCHIIVKDGDLKLTIN